MRKAIWFIAALMCGGCSFSGDKAAAEGAVVQFHQMLDAGRFHDIYATTSDDFRRVTTEADFNRILQLIHDRLGATRQASEGSWRVNFSGGSDMVVLHYATQFAGGHGDEEFIYRVSGGSARLAGFHLDLPALRGSGPPGAAAAAPGKSSDGSASQSTVSLAPPPPVEPPKPPEPAGGK